MSTSRADEALSRAKVRLRQHSPFFAVLTLFADYRFDDRVEIAETDGRRVLLNDAAFLALGDDERIGLLLHVTLHAALQHPSRMRGREPRLWNIACDVMVNHILRTQTRFPPPPGTYEAKHLDRKLVPETAEWVYEWLQRHREAAEQLRDGTSKPTDAGSKSASGTGAAETWQTGATSNGPSSRNLTQTVRKSTMANALAARFGAKSKPTELRQDANQQSAAVGPGSQFKPLLDIKPQSDPVQQDIQQRHWTAALVRAREHEEERRQGTDPSQWLRELTAAGEPELDWRVLLSRFLIQTPTDFSGFDRRFLHRGLYIETLEQESVSIAIGVDTSGSISDRDLEQIAAELNAIVCLYPHINCDLYYCDAAVHGPFALNRHGPLPTATGGGGTSFRPFFERLESMRHTHLTRMPNAAIYFTDGYGDFPEEPPSVPTLWVALPGAAMTHQFPFGEVIRMNSP
jgi:predicted metal-dependent peptidase